MNDTEQIVQHLSSMIGTSAEKRVTGVVLGMALRLKFPNFHPQDYGSLNLKQFVQTYAADRIRIVGRAGLDVVYANVDGAPITEPSNSSIQADPTSRHDQAQLTEPAPQQDSEVGHCASDSLEIGSTSPRAQTSPVSFPSDVWMAFSSPNSDYAIFANRETGEIRLDSPERIETLQAAGWSQVRSLSRQDHIDMARDFEATLPPSVKEEVSQLVGLPGKWWIRFYARLEALSQEHAAKWKAFHNLRTQQKLVKALQKSGVPPDKVTVAYASKRGKAEPTAGSGRVRQMARYASSSPSPSQRAGDKGTLRSISVLLSAVASLLDNLSDQQS